jgi:hypothetical protein
LRYRGRDAGVTGTRSASLVGNARRRLWAFRGRSDRCAKRIVETKVEPEFAYYPVTKAVGATKNETPTNVEEIDLPG